MKFCFYNEYNSRSKIKSINPQLKVINMKMENSRYGEDFE